MTFDYAKNLKAHLTTLDLQEFASEKLELVPRVKYLTAYIEEIFSTGNIAVNALVRMNESNKQLIHANETLKQENENLKKQIDFNVHTNPER